MSADLLAWAASEARAVDVELERLADRALALAELRRAALVVAGESQSLSVTVDQLVAAHKSDPAAAAGLRTILARAVGEPDDTHDSTIVEQEAQHAHSDTH